MPRSRPVRLAVISLGCPKNLVDTERALGQMVGESLVLVDDLRDADWVLVNTCGFIEDAKAESVDTILEIAQLTRQGASPRIAVAGCLSERYGEELRRELGEVDAFVGILTRANTARLFEIITGAPGECAFTEDDDRQRLRITPRHFAYLRISEGCDNRCSYCAIPDIRGPLHSRPFEHVIADAEELLSDGAVEINIIAQDTTSYGLDLYGRKRLGELLAELSRLNPLGWIRLLYAHPAHIADDVIEAIAAGFPVVPYLDLPLQHINDRMLDLMGRKVTKARVEDIISNVRARVPGVHIRTAFIVGFPGEGEEEFGDLIDFVRETRFERLGAFVYSSEEGTRAADFPGRLGEDEKMRRLDILMETQREIAYDFNRSLVGKLLPGIIDGPSGRDDLSLAGRTYGDAPEVDGTVLAEGDAAEGDLVEFEITGTEDYDLLAKVRR